MAASRHPVASNYQLATSSVPMRQDSQSFEERQKMIWDEMHERMERRRREWDDEVFNIFVVDFYYYHFFSFTPGSIDPRG